MYSILILLGDTENITFVKVLRSVKCWLHVEFHCIDVLYIHY